MYAHLKRKIIHKKYWRFSVVQKSDISGSLIHSHHSANIFFSLKEIFLKKLNLPGKSPMV